MKTFTFLAFLLFSTAALAQNTVDVILTGKVISYFTQNNEYLYYAASGEKFTKSRSIKLDNGSRYRFELSKTPYKDSTSGELYFSLDSNHTIKEHACIQKISLTEIIKYAGGKKMKVITLPNDVIPELDCMESAYMEANDQEKPYVGTYQSADKKQKLELSLVMNSFKWNFKLDKDFMDQLKGNWSASDNTIHLKGSFKKNTKFGTIKDVDTDNSLAISNDEGSLILKSTDGKMVFSKLEISYESSDMQNNE